MAQAHEAAAVKPEADASTSFGDTLRRYAFEPAPSTSTSPGRTLRSSKRLKRSGSPPASGAAAASKPTSSSPSPSRPPAAARRRCGGGTGTGAGGKRKATAAVASGYAPPSRYSHVPNLLTDALAPSLICLFVGVNPGIRTATSGHAYAHPSNLFWKLLHASACTPRRCAPAETHALPALYGLGNTNVVRRATANAAELSRAEMDAGAAALEARVRACRPEAVCLVGKGVWESVWRVRRGRPLRGDEFRYGWQGEARMGADDGDGDGWEGARIFVATSTSGLAAGLRPAEKEAIWRPLGEWVARRREEREREREGGGGGASGAREAEAEAKGEGSAVGGKRPAPLDGA